MECASELRSCVRVEVDVVGFLSLIVCTVFVDVKEGLPETFVDSS